MKLNRGSDSFLFGLLLVAFLKQLFWIIMIPAWQFPDEQAHFAQVQNVSELKSTKLPSGPQTSREIYETEKLLGTARDDFGNNKFTYHPEFNLSYEGEISNQVEDQIANFPHYFRTEGVIYEATGYPPLYYALASPFYITGYKGDLLVRIFTTRFVNLILFLGITYLAWVLGKKLFPDERLLQKVYTLLVVFHPMFSFVQASTSSDTLFNLLSLAGIYIAVKILKDRITKKNLVQLAIVIVFSLWTKPQSRLLMLIYLFPLGYQFILQKRERIKIGISILLLVIVAIGYSAVNLITGKQFLPDVTSIRVLQGISFQSFLDHFVWTLKHTYRETIPWYWGVFRWLSLTYPRFVHRILNWTSVLSVAGLGLAIAQSIRVKKTLSHGKIVWFMMYASLAYYFGITLFDYYFKQSKGFSLGIQGRYFFPTLAAHMYLLLIGLVTLVRTLKLPSRILGIVGLGMVILHTYAQYFVIGSYYDTTKITTFFRQASQYKPFFAQSPYLEIASLTYIISLGIWMLYHLRDLKHYEKP